MKIIFNMKIVLTFLSVLFTVNGFSQHIGKNTAAGKYYDIRGIKLYVETYGKGQPLVLLHGNGGNIASMSAIIPYFSKDYQVIAIDSRAQGKSVDNQDSLSFEMMADDVSALLDKMKISKADYIGWSDGGIIALIMALRHPQKVGKIAATGANIWPDSTAFAGNLWLDGKAYHDSVQYIPKKTIKDKNDWKLFQLDWLQPNISLEELHTIQKPTMIIAGDQDLIRLEHTITIFRNIPKAQLWIVPHSSHGTLQEQPKEFYETVNTFLKGKD
ncbi:MAG: alpha/beta hydrolase [Pseudopedobacter saltans]|uniref:Alpha/beta hydrolase n=1 Tax=Pseudopedobacter saltans TaxID=151895 RepID=A0A2W5H251_9SPHI|nr:MAG: alpha/beta hydrolase [Pseudopedobacter saltans]